MKLNKQKLADQLVRKRIMQGYVPFEKIFDKIFYYEQRPWHKPQYVVALNDGDGYKSYEGHLSFITMDEIKRTGMVDQEMLNNISRWESKSRFLKFVSKTLEHDRLLIMPKILSEVQVDLEKCRWYLLEVSHEHCDADEL